MSFQTMIGSVTIRTVVDNCKSEIISVGKTVCALPGQMKFSKLLHSNNQWLKLSTVSCCSHYHWKR